MSEEGDVKREDAAEFWDAAVRLWAESGLGVRAFCRQEGLAEHSFYWWRRKLSAQNGDAKVACVTNRAKSSSVANHAAASPAVNASASPANSAALSSVANASATSLAANAAKSSRNPQAGSAFVPVHVFDDGNADANPAGTPFAKASRVIGKRSAAIEIRLKTGWRVRVPAGFDPPTLDRVLAILEQREPRGRREQRERRSC
jgi:transposase-like protein